MPAWTLAPALVVFRLELDALEPDRDRTSDGTIGDARHSAVKSDHNPNRYRVVRACDTDAGHGTSRAFGDALAGYLVQLGARGTHPALGAGAYVIWERRLYSALNGWQGRPYSGVNPHTGHVHLSVATLAAGYNSRAPWGLVAALGARRAPQPTRPAVARPAPAQTRRRPPVLVTADGIAVYLTDGITRRWVRDPAELTELRELLALEAPKRISATGLGRLELVGPPPAAKG